MCSSSPAPGREAQACSEAGRPLQSGHLHGPGLVGRTFLVAGGWLELALAEKKHAEQTLWFPCHCGQDKGARLELREAGPGAGTPCSLSRMSICLCFRVTCWPLASACGMGVAASCPVLSHSLEGLTASLLSLTFFKGNQARK